MTTVFNDTDHHRTADGQVAVKGHAETATSLAEKLRPTTWTQDATLGPAVEVALQQIIQLGGYDATFGPFRMSERSPGFQAVLQDAHGAEHTAEFTPEESGIRMSLYAGHTSDQEVELDVDSFSMDDTAAGPQRLAAVLANEENGVDDRIRDEVITHCPTVAGAGQDARELMDLHPGAKTMVARLSDHGSLEADLLDDHGQAVATGAGMGLDSQYALGFGDLDEFWSFRDGAVVYDLEAMSGRPE